MSTMFLGSDFGRTVDIMHRELDVSSIRRNVIANNIANADTPNFKRSTVSFESELERVLDENASAPNLAATMTDERHIAFDTPRNYRDVTPRINLDYLSTTDANGNNVDLETEMMDEMNNQLLYTTLAQAVNFEFTQVNLVLK